MTIVVPTSQPSSAIWIRITITLSYLALFRRRTATPIRCGHSFAFPRRRNGRRCLCSNYYYMTYCRGLLFTKIKHRITYSQLRKSKLNTIPSQQSAVLSQLLPEVEKSLWQLLVPHLSPELHCVSESQSPPPTAHFFWLVQQPQFVMGTPSQDPDGGGAAVDMMLSRKNIQY